LCNETLLSAILKVLEAYLEAVLWKPFQLFHWIRNASSNTKAPSLQCWFQSSQVRRCGGIQQCCHIVLC
jgi:hypothetical protein